VVGGAGGGERGAAVVETVLVLPLLIAVLLATLAFGLAAIAKAVVTDAARDAGRVAAIECGQGDAQWAADAEAAAAADLGHGLFVGAPTATPARYGDWSFQASCATPGEPGGPAAVLITYEEVDLFPPLGALLAPGGPAGSRVLQLQAAAEFPEE